MELVVTATVPCPPGSKTPANVGDTTLERVDQGHLHPLLEHARQTQHGRGLNPRLSALQARILAKSYCPTAYDIAIQNLYSAPVHVAITHELITGATKTK
jgi:hypothetical protein